MSTTNYPLESEDYEMKDTKSNTKETARMATLLKQKVDAHIAAMEGSGTDFTRAPKDQLLIIEALNNWSVGSLGEGKNVSFTHNGINPTFATPEEFQEIISRVHRYPALLYPVSGFFLSNDSESVKIKGLDASYRLRAHTDNSRTSAVNIAKSKQISDNEACHQLWLFCATEDCVAYLKHQMETYRLLFEEKEDADVRLAISHFLQDQFSPGQVRNAIWRSVRNAAALSKRQYFNSAKAAKTIPRHIRKVLTEASNDMSLRSYDRIADPPVGAVLMLFHQKLGIDDKTSGINVRKALAAAAAPASEKAKISDKDDRKIPEKALVRGTIYFSKRYTEFDRFALSCIEGLQLNPKSPDWDDTGELGRMNFTASDLYAFNGRKFFHAVCRLLSIQLPSKNEVTQRALSMPEDRWAHETAYDELTSEALVAAGVTLAAARQICWVNRYPIEHEELVIMLQGTPIPSGLMAIRVKYADLSDKRGLLKDVIASGNYIFKFPELSFESEDDDRDIATSVLSGDTERLARKLATATARSIRCGSEADQTFLLERVAQNLLEMAKEARARNTA